MKIEDILIGGVYRTKSGALTRIFRGNEHSHMSGRGCTPQTAVPYNGYKADDLAQPTLDEVQTFLSSEMKYGMAQSWNK